MSYNLSQLKILVTDDNRHMRKLLRELLCSLGVKERNLVECEDGAGALAALKSFDADLAIVDLKMGQMDGLDVVRQIRAGKDGTNRYLPIILCTAYTELEWIEKARDAGVSTVLAKPITAKALYDHIRVLLDRPQSFTEDEAYFGPDRRRRSQRGYTPKRSDDDGIEPVED